MFRATGTILVVVGTANADTYWARAAAATGGFFAPAGNPVVVPALDQVETILRGRYLVQFPTPSTLPGRPPDTAAGAWARRCCSVLLTTAPKIAAPRL